MIVTPQSYVSIKDSCRPVFTLRDSDSVPTDMWLPLRGIPFQDKLKISAYIFQLNVCADVFGAFLSLMLRRPSISVAGQRHIKDSRNQGNILISPMSCRDRATD